MDKFQSHRQRRISQRQEKQAAEDVGGRTVAGSGAAKHSGGGDVRKRGTLRIECKYTEKGSYALKLADLTKIKMEALKGGLEQPVMQLEFVSGSTRESFAIFPVSKAIPDHELMIVTLMKQMTLRRVVIHRGLIEHGEVYVAFHRGTANTQDTFQISRWNDFLVSLEEEC